MSLLTIILAALVLLILAVVIAWILGWACKAFKVEMDERIPAINDVLPGANCGGCGYGGCGAYAEAVVTKGAAVTLCPVGGPACAEEIAVIMGVEVGEALPYRPVVHCAAHTKDKHKNARYIGEETCEAINLISAAQGCIYGCLGHGDCTRACKYDAIHIIEGLATVDYEKCIGCTQCAIVCPRNIISMTPFKKNYVVAINCSNHEAGKEVRDVCDMGCLACSLCARTSQDVFMIQNNVATINMEAIPAHLIDVKTAMEKCPRHVIMTVGVPSEKDIELTKDIEQAIVVRPDYKTTVDDMNWRG